MLKKLLYLAGAFAAGGVAGAALALAGLPCAGVCVAPCVTLAILNLIDGLEA